MPNQNEIEELQNLLFDENDDGSLDNIVEYSKNELGQVIAVSLDFDGDNKTDAKVYLEYDETGRIIKKSTDKNHDGKIDSVVTYEYVGKSKPVIHYDDNADGKTDYIESTDEKTGEIIITDVRGRKQRIVETIKDILPKFKK